MRIRIQLFTLNANPDPAFHFNADPDPLLEPETGQTVNTRIELIRPLDLKEFRPFLNKKWDLNIHHQKAIDKRQQPGIFDEARHPIPLAQATELEPPDEIEDEISYNTDKGTV
jgi:hypothetical protein